MGDEGISGSQKKREDQEEIEVMINKAREANESRKAEEENKMNIQTEIVKEGPQENKSNSISEEDKEKNDLKSEGSNYFPS